MNKIENIAKRKNGSISLPSSNSWVFNNSDSLYFKLDTLIATRNKASKSKSLCESVDWTFYQKNAFILGKESNCKEPPTRSVTKYPEDYFTIAIYKVDEEVMIDVLRNDKMIVESFIVKEIDDQEDYTKLKLIRRFNHF